MRAKDIILLVFSIVFYMWTCFDDGFRLCAYILLVYLSACWIEASKEKHAYINIYRDVEDDKNILYKKVYLCIFPFIIAVSCVVLCLIYYKYSGLLTNIWNKILNDDVTVKSLVAPLGLSFITFSAVSYLTDIYRGKATPGSLIDCALYLSFFPKVVSGPIVLWKDFQPQMKQRHMSLEISVDGLNRIMIGFAKKVLLADTFGLCVSQIGTRNVDQITAVGTLILYMLQIYYDFAGYSDVAIGLSKLFGFQFKENFNFPYRSKSISEFWRRWHISLGTWFREYVYFPLGGSRVGLAKTLRNLAIVFALTGIWHGAGWNYILWGCINGAIVLLERVIQNKTFYQKTPGCFKYIGTMFITMLCWQLFRFQSISEVMNWLGIIVGGVKFDTIFYTWKYYFDKQIIVFVIIGIIGSTILGGTKIQTLYHKIVKTEIGFLLQELILLVLFVIAILFMVNSTYSPFIYFQY